MGLFRRVARRADPCGRPACHLIARLCLLHLTPNGALAGAEAASGGQAAVLRDERAALHGVADDGAGDDVVAGSLIVMYW